MGPVRRRAMLWAGALVLSLGVTRTVVALPERCGTATPDAITTAASEAVDWFARNQRPDGSWLYRFDVDAGRDLGGYNWVRHAGVLFSLEQAAGAGIAGAEDIAERGSAAIRRRFATVGDGTALDDNGVITTGGTALTLVALAEKAVNVRAGIQGTGTAPDPDDMRSMARFLTARITERGSVLEVTDRTTGVSDPTITSPFATGQVMFALARMELLFPGEGWGAPVRHIASYLANERADAEGFVPDASDHWAAYGLETVSRWPDGALTDDELSFARRQLGIGSMQVRYESQRTNDGIDRWVRGRTALGAGVGTLGELLGSWLEVAQREPSLGDTIAATHDRLNCLSGVLIDRQVDDDEAEATANPSAARGAWLQFGITQMDDQQHTLSALLLTDRTNRSLESIEQIPRRSPVPTSVALLIIAVVAALNPARVLRRSRSGGVSGRAMVSGIGLGASILGTLAAVGGPLLRSLDVSNGNAVIAAGLALTVAGAASAFARFDPDRLDTAALTGWAAAIVPVLVPLVLRPELIVLSIAAGAGGRGWLVFIAVLAAGAAIELSHRLPSSPVAETLLSWGQRLLTFATIAAGIALVVDGVYAI